MRDLWLFLLLPLSLATFHGVQGCLECDPEFIKDIKSLLEKLVPSEVPGRTQLLEWQLKKMVNISFKVSHGNKMLRVLAVQKAISLRTWLKDELHKVGSKTWKGVFILQGDLLDIRQNLESRLQETLKHFSEVACSEDCVTTEGPVLDCWRCHRITAQCFQGEYCEEEDPRQPENQEITLFLILIAEFVILGSALLLLHICVTHRRKIKAARRSLETYLDMKLEKLMEITDEKEKEDSGIEK
ncbi:izumo sperm-egg fusion protein 3 isoform X1 [Molossus molossus]|uniref:IZUMO family member 3 n=1 Tax=Molossus molossus TaxID=27622 RepID=A0A7J8EDU9_MOLMO|nr:izumo sperm-egg fusion protein 3 isoform X1 [Molossus molossus]KAF6433634.1 IZUMO family member 3 [Molossus molossus]